MNNLGIDFYRKIQNGHLSKSQKETTLYEIRSGIARTYMKTIDSQENTLVDGELMPLIVMEPHGSGSEKDRTKSIEAPPGSVFFLGSKVDCFGLKWLVTKINYNQELKLSGEMRLCNYVLPFQDEDGNIIEEECVCEKYKTSATGEDAGKVITVDDTRRNILIQFNNNTAKILQGRRFYIDLKDVPQPKPYKLTDLDRTSYIYDGKGFFSFVCTEEQIIGDRDRPDLMICDYFEPKLPEPPSIGSCKIVFSGEPLLRVGGSTKTFSAVFMDSDGEIITTLTPTWELVMSPELESSNQIIKISEIGNEIRLQAKSGDKIIGMSFVLKIVCSDIDYGEFEASIVIEIDSLF